MTDSAKIVYHSLAELERCLTITAVVSTYARQGIMSGDISQFRRAIFLMSSQFAAIERHMNTIALQIDPFRQLEATPLTKEQIQ